MSISRNIGMKKSGQTYQTKQICIQVPFINNKDQNFIFSNPNSKILSKEVQTLGKGKYLNSQLLPLIKSEKKEWNYNRKSVQRQNLFEPKINVFPEKFKSFSEVFSKFKKLVVTGYLKR